MPIRAGWYIKDRVFIIQARGIITDEEFLALGNSPVMIQAMNNSPASTIHYFFALLDPNAKMPSLKVRGKTLIEKHPKDGWSMFINFRLNPLWWMTASIIAQVSQGRFRFLDSYQDALTFLRRVDPAIPAQADSTIEWLVTFNWVTPIAETLPNP